MGFNKHKVLDYARSILLAVVLVDFFQVLTRKNGAVKTILDFSFLFGVFAVFFEECTGLLSCSTTATLRLLFP